MKFIFTLLIAFSSNCILAQQPAIEWARNIGGASTDVGLDVATDASGNVFVCGRFAGTVDLNPGSETQLVTSNGDFDMCVIKFDATGNFLWAKSTGGTGFDQFTDVVADANGNCILSGSFVGTIQPDPNNEASSLTTTGVEEVIVLKLDPDGNTLWYYHTASDNYCQPEGIDVDSDNNIYVAGNYAGTTQFNPFIDVTNEAGGMNSTITSQGENDAFVFKVSADGSFEWVTTAGSDSFDAAKDISIDDQNNINVIGRFRSTINFDLNSGNQTATSVGLNDCFVWQINTQGMYQWHKTFGGTNYDEVWSVSNDPSGNIVTFGYYSGTVDLDPSSATQNFTSNGSDDLFVQKFDADGNLIWVKSFGGSELENSYDVACDNEGNVILTGDFFNTVDFNPGAEVNNLTSAGNNDIYFLQLTPEGEYDWAFRIGATFSQAGYAVTTDDSGNIYGTGTFSNVVDFDPGAAVANMSAQDFNIYIVKFANTCVTPELNSVSTNVPVVCSDESITVNVNGSLNGSQTWQLTSGSCSGSLIASSVTNEITFTPEVNQSYFIRSNGGCVPSNLDVCQPIAIEVNEPSESTETLTVCEGTSYTFPDGNSQVITEFTNYTSFLTNQQGCDSIVYTNVDVPFLPDNIDIQVNGTNIEVINFPSKSSIEIQWVDCNNNNTPIEGATGLTLEIPGPGSFALMYSDDGCFKITDCIIINDIQEKSISNFSLYPNPAHEGFFIQSNSDRFVDVQIFSAEGKLILSKTNHPVNIMIIFDEKVHSGVYFVQVKGETAPAHFRVVVQ